MKNSLRYFIITACIALLPFMGTAQTMFSRDYDSPGEACNHATHVQTPDGGMVFLAQMFALSGPSQTAIVFRTDDVGNLQWELHIPVQSNVQDLSNIVQSPDSSYFFASYEFAGVFSIFLIDASGTLIFDNTVNIPVGYLNMAAPVVLARNDGTFLLTGTFYDIATDEYIWLMLSIDHTGNLIWSREFNRNLGKLFHHDLDTFSNGDIVLLGEWIDTTTFSMGPALCRITSTGTLLWSKAYFEAGTTLMPKKVCVMPGDFVFVAGYTHNMSSGNIETFVCRFTAQGNEIWTLRYGGRDLFTRDILDHGHRLMLTGESQYNGYLTEIDSSGIVTWAKMYLNNWPWDIEQSTTCGYTIAASAQSNGLRVYSADFNGNSCIDSAFDITKTPLTIYTIIIGNDSIIPITLTPANFPPAINPIAVTTNCFSIGIEEQFVSSFTNIYPNPTSSTVTIISEQLVENIEVVDLFGRVVNSQVAGSKEFYLNVSGLALGCYTIRIIHENNIESRRLIIE